MNSRNQKNKCNFWSSKFYCLYTFKFRERKSRKFHFTKVYKNISVRESKSVEQCAPCSSGSIYNPAEKILVRKGGVYLVLTLLAR